METKLNTVVFSKPYELTVYVEKMGITRENIQCITFGSNYYTLFYWEVTV